MNGDTSRQILDVTTAAGSSLELSADDSNDPDGDPLAYTWTFHKEPSSYTGSVRIQNSSSDSPTVAIPADAGGTSIHIVLEIHDNGSPNLYAYRRIIVRAHP